MVYSILPIDALCKKAAMGAVYAADPACFMRSFEFEDLRVRAVEELAVRCEKVLRVGIAVGNIRIKIGCWRGGVIGVM